MSDIYVSHENNIKKEKIEAKSQKQQQRSTGKDQKSPKAPVVVTGFLRKATLVGTLLNIRKLIDETNAVSAAGGSDDGSGSEASGVSSSSSSYSGVTLYERRSLALAALRMIVLSPTAMEMIATNEWGSVCDALYTILHFANLTIPADAVNPMKLLLLNSGNANSGNAGGNPPMGSSSSSSNDADPNTNTSHMTMGTSGGLHTTGGSKGITLDTVTQLQRHPFDASLFVDRRQDNQQVTDGLVVGDQKNQKSQATMSSSSTSSTSTSRSSTSHNNKSKNQEQDTIVVADSCSSSALAEGAHSYDMTMFPSGEPDLVQRALRKFLTCAVVAVIKYPPKSTDLLSLLKHIGLLLPLSLAGAHPTHNHHFPPRRAHAFALALQDFCQTCFPLITVLNKGTIIGFLHSFFHVAGHVVSIRYALGLTGATSTIISGGSEDRSNQSTTATMQNGALPPQEAEQQLLPSTLIPGLCSAFQARLDEIKHRLTPVETTRLANALNTHIQKEKEFLQSVSFHSSVLPVAPSSSSIAPQQQQNEEEKAGERCQIHLQRPIRQLLDHTFAMTTDMSDRCSVMQCAIVVNFFMQPGNYKEHAVSVFCLRLHKLLKDELDMVSQMVVAPAPTPSSSSIAEEQAGEEPPAAAEELPMANNIMAVIRAMRSLRASIEATRPFSSVIFLTQQTEEVAISFLLHPAVNARFFRLFREFIQGEGLPVSHQPQLPETDDETSKLSDPTENNKWTNSVLPALLQSLNQVHNVKHILSPLRLILKARLDKHKGGCTADHQQQREGKTDDSGSSSGIQKDSVDTNMVKSSAHHIISQDDRLRALFPSFAAAMLRRMAVLLQQQIAATTTNSVSSSGDKRRLNRSEEEGAQSMLHFFTVLAQLHTLCCDADAESNNSREQDEEGKATLKQAVQVCLLLYATPIQEDHHSSSNTNNRTQTTLMEKYIPLLHNHAVFVNLLKTRDTTTVTTTTSDVDSSGVAGGGSERDPDAAAAAAAEELTSSTPDTVMTTPVTSTTSTSCVLEEWLVGSAVGQDRAKGIAAHWRSILMSHLNTRVDSIIKLIDFYPSKKGTALGFASKKNAARPMGGRAQQWQANFDKAASVIQMLTMVRTTDDDAAAGGGGNKNAVMSTATGENKEESTADAAENTNKEQQSLTTIKPSNMNMNESRLINMCVKPLLKPAVETPSLLAGLPNMSSLYRFVFLLSLALEQQQHHPAADVSSSSDDHQAEPPLAISEDVFEQIYISIANAVGGITATTVSRLVGILRKAEQCEVAFKSISSSRSIHEDTSAEGDSAVAKSSSSVGPTDSSPKSPTTDQQVIAYSAKKQLLAEVARRFQGTSYSKFFLSIMSKWGVESEAVWQAFLPGGSGSGGAGSINSAQSGGVDGRDNLDGTATMASLGANPTASSVFSIARSAKELTSESAISTIEKMIVEAVQGFRPLDDPGTKALRLQLLALPTCALLTQQPKFSDFLMLQVWRASVDQITLIIAETRAVMSTSAEGVDTRGAEENEQKQQPGEGERGGSTIDEAAVVREGLSRRLVENHSSFRASVIRMIFVIGQAAGRGTPGAAAELTSLIHTLHPILPAVLRECHNAATLVHLCHGITHAALVSSSTSSSNNKKTPLVDDAELFRQVWVALECRAMNIAPLNNKKVASSPSSSPSVPSQLQQTQQSAAAVRAVISTMASICSWAAVAFPNFLRDEWRKPIAAIAHVFREAYCNYDKDIAGDDHDLSTWLRVVRHESLFDSEEKNHALRLWNLILGSILSSSSSASSASVSDDDDNVYWMTKIITELATQYWDGLRGWHVAIYTFSSPHCPLRRRRLRSPASSANNDDAALPVPPAADAVATSTTRTTNTESGANIVMLLLEYIADVCLCVEYRAAHNKATLLQQVGMVISFTRYALHRLSMLSSRSPSSLSSAAASSYTSTSTLMANNSNNSPKQQSELRLEATVSRLNRIVADLRAAHHDTNNNTDGLEHTNDSATATVQQQCWPELDPLVTALEDALESKLATGGKNGEIPIPHLMSLKLIPMRRQWMASFVQEHRQYQQQQQQTNSVHINSDVNTENTTAEKTPKVGEEVMVGTEHSQAASQQLMMRSIARMLTLVDETAVTLLKDAQAKDIFEIVSAADPQSSALFYQNNQHLSKGSSGGPQGDDGGMAAADDLLPMLFGRLPTQCVRMAADGKLSARLKHTCVDVMQRINILTPAMKNSILSRQ